MAFSMQVPHGRPSCSLHPSSSQQHVPLQSRMPVPLVFENRFSTPSTCAAAVLYGRDGMKRQLCCCSAVPPSQPTGTAAGPASKPPASKKDGAQADLANKLASATSAKDKLEVLEQLGARSKNALTQSGMYGAGAPRMVDARVSQLHTNTRSDCDASGGLRLQPHMGLFLYAVSPLADVCHSIGVPKEAQPKADRCQCSECEPWSSPDGCC